MAEASQVARAAHRRRARAPQNDGDNVVSNPLYNGVTKEWKKKMAAVSQKNGALGGRPRVYASNAEKQRAYRLRVTKPNSVTLT
jgi:hypothetical protein